MKKAQKRHQSAKVKSPMVKVNTKFSATESKWLQKQAAKTGKSVSAIVRTLINESNKSIQAPSTPKTAAPSSVTVTAANVKRLYSITNWSGLSITDAIRGIVRDRINHG